MKISIVVPVYLSSNFLEKNYDNLRSQTYQNIEIIYVNDGSPDNSSEICKNFTNLDKRVRYFEQRNMGAASALNFGTAVASGDFIMYIDADDWIEQNTCELAIEVANINDADMVFWPNIKEYCKKSVHVSSFFKESRIFDKTQTEVLSRRMIGLVGKELGQPMSTDAFNAGWGKLYRADVIKRNKIEWTDTSLVGSSDVLFNAQLMPYIKRAYYLNVHLHHYNKNNPNSLTKTYNNSLKDKFEKLFGELDRVIDANYKNSDIYDSFKQALNNRIALSTINVGIGYASQGFSSDGYKHFQKLIREIIYKESYKKFTLGYLPLPYRIFFLCCKYQLELPAFALLVLMAKMRNK